MASILGGHNSRYFWNIIQAGIAPHIAAGRLEYYDAGLMIMFGFCEPGKAPQLLEALRRENDRMSREGVTGDEVERVKNRTRTGLATESEAPYYRLMQLASDLSNLDRPRDVTERLAAVEAVSAASISRYLQDWPINGPGWLASLGPLNWPEN